MQFVGRSGIAARTRRPDCGIYKAMTKTTKIIAFSIAVTLIVVATLALASLQPLLVICVCGCGPMWVVQCRRWLGNDACGQRLIPLPALVIVWRT
jgi:hypothetical protein